MSDEQRQRMHQTMQLAFDAPAALTIAETDSSVAFAWDGNAPLVLYSDGRRVTQKVEGAGTSRSRAIGRGTISSSSARSRVAGRSRRTTFARRMGNSCT